MDNGETQRRACGRTLGQRYELIRWAAGGAHASVWIARHKRLQVEVAVKFLDEAFVARPAAQLQFAKEARTAASISSNHVVRIFDYGVDQEGRPYIVMELLRGEDLATRIDREGSLSLEVVSRILTHACKGLTRAHAAGIVHRDIKPHNIFLCEPVDDGPFNAKLLDFGVATSNVEDPEHTLHGTLVGTPLYMSPEQAAGNEVDHRSDLYSLATTIFHALAGRPPFQSKNVPNLMARIATEPAPNIGRYCTKLPPEICAWFHKALRKNPSQRFPTARAMADSFVAASKSAAFNEWSSPEIDLRALLEARKRYVSKSIEPRSDCIVRLSHPDDENVDDGVNAEATLSISDLEFDAVMASNNHIRSTPPAPPPTRKPSVGRRLPFKRIAAAAVILCVAIAVGIALGSRSESAHHPAELQTAEGAH